MTTPPPRSPLPAISDELLSAYLDGQLTAAETARVEQARALNVEVAMRLEAMAHTVGLLRQTPRLAVPRSFVLSEAQVLAAGGRVKGTQPARRAGGFWAWLGGLSPRLMPLATAAVALALLVVVGMDVRGAQAPAARPASLAPAPSETPAEMTMDALRSANAPELAATAEVAAAAEAKMPAATPTEAASLAAESAPVGEAAQLGAEAGEDGATEKAAFIGEEGSAPTMPTPPAGPAPLRLLELAQAGMLAALAALTLLARRAREHGDHI